MDTYASRFAAVLIFVFSGLCALPATAQQLKPGDHFWYVPEHEQYGRTRFYAQPAFDTAMVRVTRTQRFKLVGARKGWALIEFDVAGKAYVHLRLLSNLTYNPSADDPWHEFKRASVFAEDPKKIEARLKGPVAPTPSIVDSKTPAWKSYKDGWGIKPGRSSQPTSTEEATPESTQTPSRPLPGSAAAKARSRYPLLTPIGSDPQQEPASPDRAETDPNAVAPR